MKAAEKKTPGKPAKARDATTMSQADHTLVSGLFSKYEKASAKANSADLDMLELGAAIADRKEALMKERR